MGVSISIGIKQNSQNVTGNTSNVTVEVKAAWTYGSWNATGKCTGTLTIDGVKYYFTGITFNAGQSTTGSQVIMTKTVNVGHASDGTKTLSCSASFATGVSSGTVTATGSKTLTTIPRATVPTLSATSVDMGSNVTINLPRASSSFTHDLAYSFNDAAYVSIKTGVGTSHTWTVPDKATSIPNETSGTIKIRCITKNGSTTVGTKYVSLTAKVPTTAAYMPSISAVTVNEATDGLAVQFGAFIQSKSRIKVGVTAAGAKGSAIKSYKTTLLGNTYTAASFTTGVLPNAGTLSMVTTVTDSRGRTAKKTTSITVLAYAKPKIQVLRVFRANSAGVEADDGEYMVLDCTYSVSSLNGNNTADARVQYKRSTATEYEDDPILSDVGLSNVLTGFLIDDRTFSTDYTFDVRLSVTDWFGATATATTQLPSGAVILDIGANGDCIAFGKTAEHPNTIETWWRLKTNNAEIPRDAVAIPANANLDEYTTPGYYVFSAATSGTLVGIPTGGTGSGSLEVIREGESTQVRQVLTRCSDAAREIWERLYYSNTWHTWRCIYKGGTGRMLWSGGYLMTAGHTATLSENITAQPNGIVLVFSRYSSGTIRDYHFNSFFVHKDFVAAMPGCGNSFIMTVDGTFAVMATKYLYIHNDRIVGHEVNAAAGTGTSGVKYENGGFVLRYVIGV